MPHMMPMMWSFTLIFTLSILFSVLSMIYFFYLPMILNNNNNKFFNLKNKSNWVWKW